MQGRKLIITPGHLVLDRMTDSGTIYKMFV